jgi:hypothetical protein
MTLYYVYTRPGMCLGHYRQGHSAPTAYPLEVPD